MEKRKICAGYKIKRRRSKITKERDNKGQDKEDSRNKR
jgi:hypothetical protein